VREPEVLAEQMAALCAEGQGRRVSLPWERWMRCSGWPKVARALSRRTLRSRPWPSAPWSTSWPRRRLWSTDAGPASASTRVVSSMRW